MQSLLDKLVLKSANTLYYMNPQKGWVFGEYF